MHRLCDLLWNITLLQTEKKCLLYRFLSLLYFSPNISSLHYPYFFCYLIHSKIFLVVSLYFYFFSFPDLVSKTFLVLAVNIFLIKNYNRQGLYEHLSPAGFKSAIAESLLSKSLFSFLLLPHSPECSEPSNDF